MLSGIDVRGRMFLPGFFAGALKFQDGLQSNFANVLLDGEFFAVAVFFLVHPRAQLAHELDVHALFQRRGEFR